MVLFNNPYQERGVPLSNHMSAHRMGFWCGRSFWLHTDMVELSLFISISNNPYCRRNTIANTQEECSSLWKTLKQLSLSLMQSVKVTQIWRSGMLVCIQTRARENYLSASLVQDQEPWTWLKPWNPPLLLGLIWLMH